MSACLRPDEFIDALDGVTGAVRRAHLDGCSACQATMAEVRSALAAAERAEVPEPSPLFWSQVNARVRAAIEQEQSATTGWRSWLRLDVVVPLAGLATIVVTLATAVARVPPPVTAAALNAPADTLGRFSADPPAPEPFEASGNDGALELVLDLAATLPDRGWETLGVATLPDMGDAAQHLTADERQALSAILRAAVERPPS
ncbi:MAG: hypothetical protein ABI880_00600 [Acidobacteriota bacterium]